MEVVRVARLREHAGREVEVRGWLYNRRSKGKLHFLLVRDGSGIVQCVMFRGEVPDEVFEQAGRIPQESSVIVRGVVREDERAPGGVEVGVRSLKVVAEAARDYPIQITEDVPEVGFLIKHRHLWLRSRKQAAILRVRAEVIAAIREFLDGEGFVCVDAPILTPAACEGTTTLFELQYFDEGKAYLSQSGQLYAEAAAMALGRVYCFGPTFRAEKSKTRKHLTEFWMVEPEAAFMELDGLMELAERFVSHVVARVLDRRREDLKVLERDTAPLERVAPPFPRVDYDEAVRRVNAAGVAMTWGDDFGAPQEEALAGHFDRPVMVHRFPAAIKAFYMQPDPLDPSRALCVDVIAPEGAGEIIGGSQRIHDAALLEQRIAEHGLPREAFEWYVDLRRYGTVPHSGFGLGIERTVQWITGAAHIRECIPFPRMLYRIYP
jgi:asparaginyl-tRNA synthetase